MPGLTLSRHLDDPVLDMRMPVHTLTLVARSRSDYDQEGARLGMGGRWQITVTATPPDGRAVQVSLTDLVAR